MIGLAQSNLSGGLEGLQKGFNREGDLNGLIIALAILLVPLLILILMRRYQRRAQRPETNDPVRLFSQLLRDVGFSSRERTLLERLAAGLNLAHPATLLLSPELFREQAGLWNQKLGKEPAPADEDLKAIERRLTA